VTRPGATSSNSSSTPSASTVSSPSAAPTSSVGNGSSVTPPGGRKPEAGGSTSGTKPFEAGYYYDTDGNCKSFSYVSFEGYKNNQECTPTSSLERQADRREAEAQNSSGEAAQRATLEAARLRAQIEFRKAVGNDRVGDNYIGRIESSPLYKSLEGNPIGKTMFWLGVTAELSSRSEYLGMAAGSKKQQAELIVRLSEMYRFKGRDQNGQMIFEPVAPSGSQSSDSGLAAATTGFGKLNPALAAAGWILLGTTALSPDLTESILRGMMNRGGRVYSDESRRRQKRKAAERAKLKEGMARSASPSPNGGDEPPSFGSSVALGAVAGGTTGFLSEGFAQLGANDFRPDCLLNATVGGAVSGAFGGFAAFTIGTKLNLPPIHIEGGTIIVGGLSNGVPAYISKMLGC
jgi:hypothetical protein